MEHELVFSKINCFTFAKGFIALHEDRVMSGRVFVQTVFRCKIMFMFKIILNSCSKSITLSTTKLSFTKTYIWLHG